MSARAQILTCTPVGGDKCIEASLRDLVPDLQVERRHLYPLAGPNDAIQISIDVGSWGMVLASAVTFVGGTLLKHEVTEAWKWIKANGRKQLTEKGRLLLAALDASADPDEVVVVLQPQGEVSRVGRGVGFSVRGLSVEDKLLRIYLLARYGSNILRKINEIHTVKSTDLVKHPLRFASQNPDCSVAVHVDPETGEPYFEMRAEQSREQIL